MITMDERHRSPDNTGGLLIGMSIMLIGLAILLDRAGIISGFHYSTFWGLLVLTIGLIKISNVRQDGRREGGWWVFFGAWMILNETHVWRFRESWPLLLVAIGVSMVWKEIGRRGRRAERRLE
jgi:hypothetical protein